MKSDFRDWSDVRVFLAVVRAGSTLAASKAIGLSQPTVARRIEVLEHALGVVLFERDTRGFQPTPEAQGLLAEAEALEAAAGEFAEKARLLIAGKSRVIRITSFQDAFVGGRMPRVLAEFMDHHPGVKFEFLASETLLDVGAGEADVAIRVADKIEDPTLICRKIRDIPMSLYASRSYAEKHPLPTSAAELSGHLFVVYEGRLAKRASQVWLRARIEPEQIAMTVDGLAEGEAAVSIGAGMAVWPTGSIDGPGVFIKCFDLPPETSLTSWLLVNPTAWRRPEVKAFAAFFVPRYRALFR